MNDTIWNSRGVTYYYFNMVIELSIKIMIMFILIKQDKILSDFQMIRRSISFQMDQATGCHVSAHHLAGAALGVHAARRPHRVGGQLPVPLGPHLILSGPRARLVHHGLGAASHCPGTGTVLKVRTVLQKALDCTIKENETQIDNTLS
jgi:hypothetical protein